MTNDELYDIIKDNYKRINAELSDINQQIKPLPRFQADYEGWKDETKEWRSHICKKIEEIKITLQQLPCPERKGKYEALSREIKSAWGVFIFMMGLVTYLVYIHIK